MLKFFDDASIFTFPIAAASITVLLIVLLYILKDMDLPPGPTGLPFLGYYPFLRQDFYIQLQEMSKKYGDVFSLRILGQLYIHISSLKALREAHVVKGDCFTNRMSSYNVLKYCFENGMSFLEGERWRTLRKFYVQNLREYGLFSLKDGMAGPVYDSLLATIEDFKATQGAPFDAVATLTKHSTKTMHQLLFKGVAIKKEDIEQLNAAYMDVIAGMLGFRMFLSGSIAKYIILPFTPGHKEMISGKYTMEKIISRIVAEHETSFDEDNPRDLIDCYIRERRVRERQNDPTAEYFTDAELVDTLHQILGDGVIVVAHFISMFLKILADHQDVQEKIHEELLEIVGSDRQPSWEDKNRLPYCNGVILEILRSSDVLSAAPSLECTRATTLNGYKIPRGCVTLVNNWAIYHDEELYENPEIFDPTRFIAKPGKPKAETPMPFGIGKRACAGEPFVMMQVFLFMVTIVKNFKISAPEVKQDTNMSTDLKLQLCVQLRTNN